MHLKRVVNLANPHTTHVAIAVPTSMVIHKIIEMDADICRMKARSSNPYGR